LKKAKKNALSGERRANEILKIVKHDIRTYSSGKIQYAECVRTDTLEPLKLLNGKVMIALAVYFGKTRLIDNIIFRAT